MEAFEGIFVCTTNLMSKLDQASLRRFAFKVRFDPLKPDQRIAMFRQELARLSNGCAEGQEFETMVRRLEQLTPGDFAVTLPRRFREVLVTTLRDERAIITKAIYTYFKISFTCMVICIYNVFLLFSCHGWIDSTC
jgi:SpoVK/Ycf46/Vps4 family AAA+-type ATPase